tara:strand:+ start:3559 stop:4905 length:1347 start_codon:yes stop_codon:yes gene_type:complete
MKFGLIWINSRKSLFFLSNFDFLLFYYLFIKIYKDSISDLLFLNIFAIITSFIWITSSYIIGRYAYIDKDKNLLLISQLSKTIFSLIINLLITQAIFLFFWDWNIISYLSFSNFVNDFSKFYLNLFLLSYILQCLFFLYISKKYNKKSIWLYWGNEEKINYLNSLINNKSTIKIEKFNNENLYMPNTKGVIIENEESILEKDIKFIFDLNNKGIKLYKVSKWCERYISRYPSELVKVSEIIEEKFFYNKNGLKARIKRFGESFISILLLIITLPLLLFSAILIKVQDGGPIFYTQSRTGFEGKTFKIIKLRTMIINAEKNGVQWSQNFDKRITNLGSILRKLRIDELPQLILVLSGKMSLIGPRPERPDIDKILRKKIDNYDLRYSVKPGISGWAQVNYPYGASIEDSKLKLSYDLYYIKNFSFFLDLVILFKTMRLVLNGKGSKPKH